VRAAAEARLARAELARGQLVEAITAARHAHDVAESLGGLEDGDALVRLAYAECLDALGQRREAAIVIKKAVARLKRQADAITNAAWRSSFLTRFSEHVAIVRLAREWAVGLDDNYFPA
jgi:hypothetical protein